MQKVLARAPARGWMVALAVLLSACGGGTGSPPDGQAVLSTWVLPTCHKTLAEFGASGNVARNDESAITANTAAVQAAFDSQCNLDGQGLEYVVRGSLELKGNGSLSNAKFFQAGSATDIRTLMRIGGTTTLRNVRVDRGVDERNGGQGNSAGVFLQGVSDALLEDVEVTGNGYGAGIWVNGSTRVSLLRPNVHDMRWSTATPPQYEMLLGIWINDSTQVSILNGRVLNLLGETGDNVYRSWQSDGITGSGTDRLSIFGTAVENTGEGMDLTGSAGNQNFEIAHSSAIDSDSFGFKLANYGRYGLVRDSVAIRSGYAGFVVQGPSEASTPGFLMTDVTLLRNRALNPGYNGRWNTSLSKIGFLVMAGPFHTSHPQRVRVLDSRAEDDQSTHTMRYGFYSQAGTGPNGNNNVDSTGHTTDGGFGFVASAYGFDFVLQKGQEILGCQLKARYVDWYFDQSYLQAWTQARLIADLQDAANRALQPQLCQ